MEARQMMARYIDFPRTRQHRHFTHLPYPKYHDSIGSSPLSKRGKLPSNSLSYVSTVV